MSADAFLHALGVAYDLVQQDRLLTGEDKENVDPRVLDLVRTSNLALLNALKTAAMAYEVENTVRSGVDITMASIPTYVSTLPDQGRVVIVDNDILYAEFKKHHHGMHISFSAFADTVCGPDDVLVVFGTQPVEVAHNWKHEGLADVFTAKSKDDKNAAVLSFLTEDFPKRGKQRSYTFVCPDPALFAAIQLAITKTSDAKVLEWKHPHSKPFNGAKHPPFLTAPFATKQRHF